MPRTATPAPASTAPIRAPEETPATPDVWSMPDTGIGWCDCGRHHRLTPGLVEDFMEEALGGWPRRVTHRMVCRVLMRMWRYVEVCAFFHDAVARSATAVNGRVAPDYPTPVARDIIGHFGRTWQGCPEEACAGGFGEAPPGA